MIRAKKHLGQHFLTDLGIAQDIVNALTYHHDYTSLLEIGPGTGVLTQYLIENNEIDFKAFDVDTESIDYLRQQYKGHTEKIICKDFLNANINEFFSDKVGVIGNFPYNISSQIFFKVLEHREKIPEVVGMLQREVAQRLASKHGNKTYGILSVLLQAYYDIDYLFEVPPEVFNPPPKVHSAVIRIRRNDRGSLGCNEKLFKRVVKTAFGMRRKKLRNALKVLGLPDEFMAESTFDLRAEQLSVEEFIALTKRIEKWIQ